MPLKLSSRIQAGLPIANFANYAKIVKEFAFEERVGNSLVVREPVGVVGAITPWNYPLHQIALKVAPALAAGCTVVLKPSEIAPFNAFILAEVVEAAGLPTGVFNLVTGYGPAVGEALVEAPGRRHDLVHRLDARRQADLRARGADGEARGARARRQERLGDPRRRRPRRRGEGHGERLLPQLRPDLHRADAHAGARVALRRGSEASPPRRRRASRSAIRCSETTRLGPLSSQAQLERVRGYIKKGIAEGAELVDRRRRAARRRAGRRLLRDARPCSAR